MGTSRYFYRIGDDDCGPLTFQELVALVRGGSLTPDHLVRPEWESRWRPAEQIIGLFRMALLPDAGACLDPPSALEGGPRAIVPDDSERFLAAVETREIGGDSLLSAAEPLAPPAWQTRLRELAQRGDREAASFARSAISRPARPGSSAVPEAIEDALRATARREPGLWRRRLRSAFPSETVQAGFRWGLALGVANMAVLGLMEWSDQQALRFPAAEGVAEILPVIGRVSSHGFALAMMAVMLCGGLAGYGGARLLERSTG